MSGQYPINIIPKLSDLTSDKINIVLSQLISLFKSLRNGQVNSTGSVSLEYTGSGTNVTTVLDPLCTINSTPSFTPTNLCGAKALAALYVTNIIEGSFDINWDETVATVSGGNPANLNYVLLG